LSKDGIGVGSASIVLVFAVLCLTVFSLITLVVAGNDKSLVDTEAQLITSYYEADTLAEYIIADIAAAGDIPASVRGIDIEADREWDTGAMVASFVCPISEQKELFVRVSFLQDSYDIQVWRMLDIGEWVVDNSINVWQGPDEVDFGDPLDAVTGLG